MEELQPLADADTVKKGEYDPAATTRINDEPLIGSMLSGRYLVKRKLGRGGFGVVYLASDEKMLSRPVVIKALIESEVKNEWTVRKFKQEIEALARIDHPSIVGIFDVGELPDGKPFIVMQYVDGFSLRQIISPEGVDFWRAANIIRQIGRALTAAHDRGILHRDLKPENIMIQTLGDGEEQVKIIDFGIARVKNSVVSMSTAIDRTVGTIAYMSPEQLSAGQLSQASDVYCFGVIAYELLTGRRPANPESVYQLLEMQRSGVRIKPVDLRPGLPQKAEAIILKALAFDPKDRYQRARDFGDLLSSALPGGDEQPVLAVGNLEVPAKLRSVAPSLAPKRMAGITAAVLGALLVGTAAFFALNPRSGTEMKTPVEPALPEQSLTYSLTVQKMRQGKPDGGEIEMTGQEVFGNGWKFRFNIMPEQAGSLYLLNEGPGPDGATEYNVLFPTPGTGGSSQIPAPRKVTTGWNYFVDHTGVEKLWIIWSDKPILDLDLVFRDAGDNQGVIAGEASIAKVQNHLKAATPAKVEANKSKEVTVIKARGNVVVSLVELSHKAY
ncbi:hypothetical protein BH18ACI4_BH18ACI4_17190 [soil metagenome]